MAKRPPGLHLSQRNSRRGPRKKERKDLSNPFNISDTHKCFVRMIHSKAWENHVRRCNTPKWELPSIPPPLLRRIHHREKRQKQKQNWRARELTHKERMERWRSKYFQNSTQYTTQKRAPFQLIPDNWARKHTVKIGKRAWCQRWLAEEHRLVCKKTKMAKKQKVKNFNSVRCHCNQWQKQNKQSRVWTEIYWPSVNKNQQRERTWNNFLNLTKAVGKVLCGRIRHYHRNRNN